MDCLIRSLVLFGVVALLAGCTSAHRRGAVPADAGWEAHVPDMPANIRRIGDQGAVITDGQELEEFCTQNRASGLWDREQHYLALSSGGASSAFSAGLLVGWSVAGDRPQFNLVTGISSGALIAPLIFLGPEYDDELRDVYATITTEDIYHERTVFSVLFDDGLVDPTPLEKLIEKHIDERVMEAVAVEHRRGRRLIMSTTNLDMMQPVYWDIGRIANVGTPEALELIRKIMLASASIPGMFPPVYFDVTVDGKTYDEIHVDGGVVSQVFSYPLNVEFGRVLDDTGASPTRRLYIIRNSQLNPNWRAVEPKLFDISKRSLSGMIRSQSIGNLYQLYLGAQRDHIGFYLAFIPESFGVESDEPFDPDYMRGLFELGYSKAKTGYPWHNHPPGYAAGSTQRDQLTGADGPVQAVP